MTSLVTPNYLDAEVFSRNGEGGFSRKRTDSDKGEGVNNSPKSAYIVYDYPLILSGEKNSST